jgi:hypothetical protein
VSGASDSEKLEVDAARRPDGVLVAAAFVIHPIAGDITARGLGMAQCVLKGWHTVIQTNQVC